MDVASALPWTPPPEWASRGRLRPVTVSAPTSSDLILAIARQRDRAAFATLFRDVAPAIRRYLMSAGVDAVQADELVQEVMVTVWRRAETFDPSRASGSTWLFTIARNKRIDALRRERRPEIDLDDPALVAAPERSADAAVDEGRRAAAVREALADLPPEQAQILRRAYFDDQSLSTIAGETEVPLGTVKSRVRLAFARLRGLLGEDP